MFEKDVEKLLVEEVKRIGGRAYKFVSPGNDGVPDRVVIFPDGRVVFAELKSDKGRLSPIQEKQIERMRRLNADVDVVQGVDGVISFFYRHGYPKTGAALIRRYRP